MRHLAQQGQTGALAGRIDPRVRILAAAFLLVLVVSSGGSGFPWLVAAACLPAAALSGMRLRVVLLRLLHPLFIAAVILGLKTFTGGADTPLTLMPALTINAAGLQEGLLTTARIMGAVSVAILLSQVMTFTETMAALAWLRMPAGLVEVSLFAWRALFMLYDDAGTVYTAQKNRLGYCGLRRGLRSFGTMAGMLTIRAFDNSHAMTTAMTLRGYDGTMPLLRGARPAGLQLAGLLLFALAATAAWSIQN